ncbi:DUF1289 domain-containing protein [Marinomonas algicola]|uniref:DUF1289 domain-containing protein n=1 Tax=Marinomonas algicola TaxID=2773454 RepID=UPI001EFF37DA|nr:DUF1289 domain-containing protein [Marinomonas algicola]
MVTKETPCVRRCCLDQKDVCMGCFRTLDEILHWHQYNEEEAKVVFALIEKRRNAYYRLFPKARLLLDEN